MFRIVLAAVLVIAVSVASAQERIAGFDNSVRLEYWYVSTGEFKDDYGSYDIGTTDTHVLLLSGVWSLNDRWKIYGSLPYVQKRLIDPSGYDGTHNPLVDFVEYTPPDLRFVDDGDYHGGFQDLFVGAQFLAVDGPAFKLSPFVSYGVPVTDYPIYGSAVIGRGLRELHLGVSLEFIPYFSDWYFSADIAYAFSEHVVGVDPSYWSTYFSAGYYITPRFVPRVFLTTRHSPDGLRFPEDFEPYEEKYDSENGWRHDQTLVHNYINAGVGFDYIVSERYLLSATYFRTIDADNLFNTDYALTVALMRSF